MVLVIVFVHSVAADEMQIRVTRLELLTNGRDMHRVIVIVNWISFLLPNDTAIEHVAFPGETNLNELAFAQLH